MGKQKVKKMCLLALFCSIAIICSYIELLIPFNIGIPGVKLGLPNVVTLTILLTFGFKEAFLVLLLRVFIVGITFTNLQMMLYSICGGLVSIIMMGLLNRVHLFHPCVISIFGGIFHNVGQIIIAMVIVSSFSLLYYLPYLIVIGSISGLLIGLLGNLMYQNTHAYIYKIMK